MIRLYRRLARLLLGAVSREFGDEMAETAAALAKEARGRGPVPWLRYWLVEFQALAHEARVARGRKEGGPMFASFLQDARFALRALVRHPGFACIAIATLALGIGATTLMFSVVNAVLLRPLPYPDPDRLVLLFNVSTTAAESNTIRATALDFDDYRARARSFAAVAAHVGTGFTFTGSSGPELVLGQMVSPDFFTVLGAQPLLGRVFAADEFSPGRSNVLVLTHRFWTDRFGGDLSIVGRQVIVNGKPFIVVGVMPAGIEYPGTQYALWTPLPTPRTPELPPVNRSSHYLQVVARLKPSVPLAQAAAEIRTLTSTLAAQYPESNQNLTARITPLAEFAVKDVRAPLQVLLGAVGLVVLIACANVTNLLLARATVRHREVAIRQALGAGRGRLIRQLLTETIILYATGAAVGLGLATGGASAIRALGPSSVPRLASTSLDARVLAATAALSLLTALVFGLMPALQGSAGGAADALRSGSRTIGRAGQRVRTALVVVEVALAVVLLVGAGLALRSLVRLTHVDPGFDADGQLTFSVVMPPAKYPTAESMISTAARLSERLASLSGVSDAGLTTHLPLSGQNLENGFEVDGYVTPQRNDVPVAGMRGIAGRYMEALGMRLKSGRWFTPADRADSQPVAIVNEAFARRYWPNRDPLGRRVREGGSDRWRAVVGVIADVKHAGPAEEARPEVSIPYSQLDSGFLTTWSRGVYFVLRGSAGTLTASAARAAVASVDPDMALNHMDSMAHLANEAVSAPRFRTALFAAFGALAIGLASVGVFGVLSYFVGQRTREIGIRIALGANRRDVLIMIVGRGLALAAIGLALGLAAAVPLTASMRSFLFEVSPLDAPTLAGVFLVLAAVAVLASYVPARRALRIQPIAALNPE